LKKKVGVLSVSTLKSLLTGSAGNKKALLIDTKVWKQQVFVDDRFDHFLLLQVPFCESQKRIAIVSIETGQTHLPSMRRLANVKLPVSEVQNIEFSLNQLLSLSTAF
jgi:hypothetical protein